MTNWPAAPAELPALDHTVHVWAVRLDDGNVDLDAGREMLSSDERERATRFHFERDRRRYLLAWAIDMYRSTGARSSVSIGTVSGKSVE